MKKLIIDETFKKLIPPLTEEEYTQLEKNILTDGCREPLVVWNGIIIDGHNRYQICSNNNITFNVEEKEFSSKEQAVEWIILNQFGRRNLSLIQRGELALKLKPIIQEKAKENKIDAMKIARESNPNNSNEQFCQNSDKTVKKVDTKKELAKIAGVSHDTITKTEKILKKGTEEQIDRARQGGKGNTLNAIYHEIRQQEEETKVCKTCGKTFHIANFYKGRNDCRECYAQKTSKIRDVKGNEYKVSDKYKDVKEEDVIGDLYNVDKVVERDIEGAIEVFQSNFENFLDAIEDTLEYYEKIIKKDTENNEKMMDVFADAVTTFDEWKGRYLYEK